MLPVGTVPGGFVVKTMDSLVSILKTVSCHSGHHTVVCINHIYVWMSAAE